MYIYRYAKPYNFGNNITVNGRITSYQNAWIEIISTLKLCNVLNKE